MGDDSRNSMDVSRTCANRTLCESPVSLPLVIYDTDLDKVGATTGSYFPITIL